MFVIVRDVVRHANLNETINYKISLHLSIQGCLALACLGEFHLLFLYPASQYCLALYHRNEISLGLSLLTSKRVWQPGSGSHGA
jgi:hypothetical protein